MRVSVSGIGHGGSERPKVSNGLGCPLVRRGVPVVQPNGLFAGMAEGAVHQGTSDFFRLLRGHLTAAKLSERSR